MAESAGTLVRRDYPQRGKPPFTQKGTAKKTSVFIERFGIINAMSIAMQQERDHAFLNSFFVCLTGGVISQKQTGKWMKIHFLQMKQASMDALGEKANIYWQGEGNKCLKVY